MCPGESASVGVVEDGSARVSVASGFIGGLNSFELEIRVRRQPSQGQTQIDSVTISGGSYRINDLKADDSVTLSYESSGDGKMTVEFTFLDEEEDTDTGTDEDQPRRVTAKMCAAVYTITLSCDDPDDPFGDVVFQGWKCKTYDLIPTEEIPTSYSGGWVHPVMFSQAFPECGVLLYVKNQEEAPDCSLSPCSDPPPSLADYPPKPHSSNFSDFCSQCT